MELHASGVFENLNFCFVADDLDHLAFQLKVVFDEFGDSPLELDKALSDYRFAKIDEMLGVDTCSFNRVFGYFAQILIVENWLKLNKKQGLEIVENIVKEPT